MPWLRNSELFTLGYSLNVRTGCGVDWRRVEPWYLTLALRLEDFEVLHYHLNVENSVPLWRGQNSVPFGGSYLLLVLNVTWVYLEHENDKQGQLF